MPPPCPSVASYDTNENTTHHPKTKQQVEALLRKALEQGLHEPFLLVGPRGSGKSRCLEAAFQALRRRYVVFCFRVLEGGGAGFCSCGIGGKG